MQALGSQEHALLAYLEGQQTRQSKLHVRLLLRRNDVLVVLLAFCIALVCAYLITVHISESNTPPRLAERV